MSTANSDYLSPGEPHHPLNRFLRAAVDKVTSQGPPPPQRVLTPLRREALRHAVALHRERGDQLGERLRSGDRNARAELSALARNQMPDSPLLKFDSLESFIRASMR